MAGSVRFAKTRDGVLVAHSSEGAGEPLVFVRGWITHLEYNGADPPFRAFLDRLTAHFRVIRYDGRGNGLSDRDLPSPVDLDALVADLEAVIDAEQLDTTTLWGSSFGGPIAIAYTARHPERVKRLVLDGTFANGAELASPERREEFLTLLRLSRAAPNPVLAGLAYMTDPEPGASIHRRVERLRKSISTEAMIELYSLLYEIDVEPLLPSIAVPTLVMHRRGSQSVAFALGRKLATKIAGAQFVGFEGRSHNLWEESPAEALVAMGGFLGVGDALASGMPTTIAVPVSPVAVLFTDIVGSTEFTTRAGDELAQDLVRAHNSAVRGALAAYGGNEVKHTGDGIMASFPSVSSAIAAAAMMQSTLESRRAEDPDATPTMRIGINAGEPLSDDDDLFGTVVQLARRACEAAGADEIVVTGVVRDLAAGKGFRFFDRGAQELKGFDEPVRLWQVDWH